MILESNVAQSIAARIMNLLNYNINIMDQNGLIIGSGDRTRLGKYHHGAGEVLMRKSALEIKKEDLDSFPGAKEGVNLPIDLNDKIVGVVGITGNPEEVRPYAAIIKVIVELMLEQTFYQKQLGLREQAKSLLINDLVKQNSPGNIEVLRTRASILGYNLDAPGVVIVFRISEPPVIATEPDPSRLMGQYDWSFHHKLKKALPLGGDNLFALRSGNEYVLLNTFAAGSREKNKIIQDVGNTLATFNESNQQVISAGVGKVYANAHQISESFRQALEALEIGIRLLQPGSVYDIEELDLEIVLARVGKEVRQDFIGAVLHRFKANCSNEQYHRLLETAKILLKNNIVMDKTAKELFIHRNTLDYRLNQIKKKAGLDLKNSFDDAVKFKLALLCQKYDQDWEASQNDGEGNRPK